MRAACAKSKDLGREGQWPLRAAGREALLLLCSALILGFVYTAVTEKGLFAPSSAALRRSFSPAATNGPQMITLKEAKDLHASQKGFFIDTRGELLFRAGHIPGATNIPLAELDAEVDFLREVSAEMILVPYCDGSGCHSSFEFSNRLSAFGVSNIKVFLGGWDEWKGARLPIATS